MRKKRITSGPRSNVKFIEGPFDQQSATLRDEIDDTLIFRCKGFYGKYIRSGVDFKHFYWRTAA